MSANVGYIRVSSVDQNIDRQLDGIELTVRFIDKCSGANEERPQFTALQNYLREGDHVYIHSMDRLARNLRHLLTVVHDWLDRGIIIHFVTENMILDKKGTISPTSYLLLNVFGAFSQFEKALINERQREGIAKAKALKKPFGRPAKITPAKVVQIIQLAEQNTSIGEISRQLGIHRSNISRCLAKQRSLSNVVVHAQ